jgi:hypothetical protein
LKQFVIIDHRRANKRAADHKGADAASKIADIKSLLKSGPTRKVKKLNLHYPERTDGSKHARELRERTNNLSDKERAELFERAMQRIYVSRVKATVGAGH